MKEEEQISIGMSGWGNVKAVHTIKPVSEDLVSEDDGIIKIHYHKMRGDLDDEAFASLASCDIDGSGSLTLSEILSMSNRNKRLRSVVLACVIAIFLLLGCMFCVSWAAAVLAEQTDVGDSGTQTAKGSNKVIAVAEAVEAVPVAFASLLDKDALARIKEITMSNLAERVYPSANDTELENLVESGVASNDDDTAALAAIEAGDDSDTNSTAMMQPCNDCPPDMAFGIKAAMLFSETHVKFIADTGTEIDIVKGVIQVTNVPGFAEREFIACGSAKCSTIQVGGVDVNDLKKRAEELDFDETAGARRSGVSLPSHCSDSKVIAQVTRQCNLCYRMGSRFANHPRCLLGYRFPMAAKQVWYNEIMASWQTTRTKARSWSNPVWAKSFWGESPEYSTGSRQWAGRPASASMASYNQSPYPAGLNFPITHRLRSPLRMNGFFRAMRKGGEACLHMDYLKSKTFVAPPPVDYKAKAKQLFATARRYQQQYMQRRTPQLRTQCLAQFRQLWTLLKSRACTTRHDKCRPFF